MDKRIDALTRIQFFMVRTTEVGRDPKQHVVVRIGSDTIFQDYIDPSGTAWLQKLQAAPEWLSKAIEEARGKPVVAEKLPDISVAEAV